MNLYTDVHIKTSTYKKVSERFFIKSSAPLWLSSLLLRSFFASIRKYLVKEENHNLPGHIGMYQLVVRIQKPTKKKTFSMGIYADANGKKAIGKMWQGQTRDFYYHTFVNEVRMYILINTVLTRVKKSMPKRFHNITVPKLLAIYGKKDSLLLLIEYKKGDLAFTLPAKKKLKVYFTAIDFLQFLGKNMTEEEKGMVAKRSPFDYVLLYPLVFIKALFTYPRFSFTLCKGIPVFLSCIPTLFLNREEALVHRDLHFKNLIVLNDTITIIDLQYFVFTEILHELVTTLRYRWGIDEFQYALVTSIIKRLGKRKGFHTLFKGLIANSVTHALTDKRFSANRVDSWIDLLNFAFGEQYKEAL